MALIDEKAEEKLWVAFQNSKKKKLMWEQICITE